MYFVYYIPFFGRLSIQAHCAYFFHSLSLLTQTGVHLITGLSVAQESMSHPLMKSVTHSIKNDVQEGVSMGNAMLKHVNTIGHANAGSRGKCGMWTL